MVILIIAIENFPKENYNFNYSTSPHLMYPLLQRFPECSLQPFILSYLFWTPTCSHINIWAAGTETDPYTCASFHSCNKSRLEIHLQCALLLTINKSITCLPFPWNYSHPWKKRILHTLDLFWSLASLPWQEHTISGCHFLHIQP